jgi:predicted N-acetyltransferase YhbS
MTIRKARKDEAAAVENLIKSVYADYEAVLPPQVFADWMVSISESIEADWDKMFVAVEDGNIVGAVQLIPNVNMRGRRNVAVLGLLAVAREGRGKNYGRRLTEECIRAARESGCDSIMLHTNKFMKSAIKLYEGLGFVRCPEYDASPLGPDDDTIAYVKGTFPDL